LIDFYGVTNNTAAIRPAACAPLPPAFNDLCLKMRGFTGKNAQCDERQCVTIPKPAQSPMPPAVKFVLAAMVLNAMGFGIIVPVVPRMLMEISGLTIDSVTAIGGWLAFTFALTQFIFSPILGNLSDRFGRRPILLGSLAGFSLDFFVLAFAPTLTWVFMARAISGMFGASNGPAQAVIADITPPELRARYFGLLGAAFGIGFVIGPVVGGLLSGFGHRVPFIVAGLLAAMNVVYGYFNLPETLMRENRRPFDWRRANPVGSLLHVQHLPGIGTISTVYLFWQLASLVYPMTWAYYTIGRYGWSEQLIAGSLGLVGASMVATQILILPRVVARLGERKTAMIGIAGAGLAMFGYIFASDAWMAFSLLPLMAFQSLVHANLTSMMTRRADATNQGEVQGFASGVMAVGSIIAPLLYNPALAYFTGPHAPLIFHGAAFAIATSFAVIALIVLARMQVADRPDPALMARG
jgi:MFS transporter, DHA1 family, tetracycline resistance protein